MSKVEQMEAELRKLSQTELRQIREWLDDMIEDQAPFTPEFEHSIQQAEPQGRQLPRFRPPDNGSWR